MPLIKGNNIEIMMEDLGPEDGSPLILIRGLGTQMIQWPDTLLQGFRENGFRPIIFDNRDVGLSQKFGGHGKVNLLKVLDAQKNGIDPDLPYTVHDMAGDVIAVLDHLDIDRAHVFGISMGGMIAQRVALNHPDRVLTLTSVMSHSGNPDLPRPEGHVQQMLMGGPRDESRDAAIDYAVEGEQLWGCPGYPVSDDDVRAIQEKAYDRCYYPEGVGRQYAALLADSSRYKELHRIIAPTLVIHGTDDVLVNVQGGRDTHTRIAHSEYEEISGMGHTIPPTLAPILVDRVVQFIASQN